MNRLILAVAGLMLLSASAMGEPPRQPDPIAEAVFPPELVMRFAQEIGLTQQQRESAEGALKKAGARFPELQQQLQQEVQAMAAIVKTEYADVDKALAQLDKVLGAEREIKRLHMGLILGIKNTLTPAQQAQLQELKQKAAQESPQAGPAAPPPPALQNKIQKVQALIKQWQAEGRDLSEVGPLMEALGPLMREQKFTEAEAVLDKALTLLGR
jgi:Spy/CpxP family protein refolding chaperone